MKKIRQQILLDPEQLQKIEQESVKTGASKAEIIRRAIMFYFKKRKK